MSKGFAKGDLVVCIDAKPDSFDLRASLLIERRIYRVAVAGLAMGQPCIGFDELRSDTPNRAWGFHVRRFRKLDAPRTGLADRIRACHPHDQQVSA